MNKNIPKGLLKHLPYMRRFTNNFIYTTTDSTALQWSWWNWHCNSRKCTLIIFNTNKVYTAIHLITDTASINICSQFLHILFRLNIKKQQTNNNTKKNTNDYIQSSVAALTMYNFIMPTVQEWYCYYTWGYSLHIMF